MTIILKVSIVLSVIVYYLTALLFGKYISLEIIDWGFAFRVLILTAISWVPVFVFRVLKDRIDPSDYKKIMKDARSTEHIIEPFSSR